MLPIKIDIKARPPEVSKRAWNAATKAGFAAAGKLWHEKFLPGHFRGGAASKYAYRPRSRKYLETKRKAASQGKAIEGGRSPLVYTGLMKDMLTGHPIYRAFPSRVAIRMIGPRYIGMRVFKANQPNKAGEVTKVLPAERRELATLVQTTIRAAMAKRKGSK